MEVCAPLVRAWVRAFYTDEHAAVVERLLLEPFYLEDDGLAKGTLTSHMGGLNALRIRQLVQELEAHSVVQRKGVAVPGDVVETETGFREGPKQTHDFFFIDLVHFIKVANLRLHQLEKKFDDVDRESAATAQQFACPRCDRIFDMLSVQTTLDYRTGMFVCPNDGLALEERASPAASSSSSAYVGGGSMALKKRFREQIGNDNDVDRRDSIREYLYRANNLGVDVPNLNPEIRVQRKRNEVARTVRAKNRERSGLPPADEDGEDGADMDDGGPLITATAASAMPSALPSYLAVSSVTGKQTEDAMRDAEERQLKMMRHNEAMAVSNAKDATSSYVEEYQRKQLELVQEQQQQEPQQQPNDPQPPAPPPKADDPTFTYMDGTVVRASEITADNWDDYSAKCNNDEYEAFTTFCDLNCFKD